MSARVLRSLLVVLARTLPTEFTNLSQQYLKASFPEKFDLAGFCKTLEPVSPGGSKFPTASPALLAPPTAGAILSAESSEPASPCGSTSVYSHCALSTGRQAKRGRYDDVEEEDDQLTSSDNDEYPDEDSVYSVDNDTSGGDKHGGDDEEEDDVVFFGIA